MIPGRAAWSMLLAAALTATPAFGADTPAAGAREAASGAHEYPDVVKIAAGETLLLSLPESATFMLSETSILTALRVKTGVELRAKWSGSALLFIFDGNESTTITVNVGDPKPTFTPPQVRLYRPGEDDEDVRILTGGVINNGAVGYGSALGEGASGQTVSGALSGNTPDWGYQLQGIRSTGNYAREDLAASGHWSWGLAEFSQRLRRSEFQQIWNLGLQPYRDAFVYAGSAKVALEGDLRFPLFVDRVSLNPIAGRAAISGGLGAFTLGAGSLLSGLSSGPQHTLPFATVGTHLGTFTGTATGGFVPGTNARIGAATASLGLGKCTLAGQYTTGLRGADGGALQQEFQAYVPGGLDAYSAQASCTFKGIVFSGGASGGGPHSAFVDNSGVLFNGFAGLFGDTPGDALTTTVVWSGSGNTFRDQAVLYGSKRLGEFVLSLSEMAIQPQGNWRFSETASLRRDFTSQFSQAGVGLSAGTSHAFSAPDGFWTSLDARWTNTSLVASLSLQNNVYRDQPISWMTIAQLQWLPFANYILTASSAMDLRLYRNWNVNFSITYAFGDNLPREPLLAPFRSSTFEAFAFEDINGDGVWQKEEPPLPGVSICLDGDPCATTGPDGRFLGQHLVDGRHKVRVDASAVEGAVPTGDVDTSFRVGGLGRTAKRFGFRRSGEVVLHAYVDRNNNGLRDPGETDVLQGEAEIDGAEVQSVVHFGSEARVAFHRLGRMSVRPNALTIPTGYVSRDVELNVDSFRRYDVDVPLRALRAISGHVCLADAAGKCLERQLSLPRIRVRVDGHEAVTSEDGTFLVEDLPAGTMAITPNPRDFPPGFSPLQPTTVTLPDGPEQVNAGIALALQPLASRPDPFLFGWQGEGSIKVRQVGGYFFSPDAPATIRAPAAEDLKILRALVRHARKSGARVAIVARPGAAVFARDAKAALAGAAADASALGAWFARRAGKSVALQTGADTPLGATPVVEIRLLVPVPDNA